MKKDLFIIRKFIFATSAEDAIKQESKYKVHDVFLEENFYRTKMDRLIDGKPGKKIGYGD